jgi:NTE family protein
MHFDRWRAAPLITQEQAVSRSPAPLAAVEAFRHLPPEELAQLERTLRMLSLARGQALVRQGDPAEALYIVVSGRFKVLRDGALHRIAEIGAGQPVGEIAFFAGGTRTATVIAERDSLVLELKREDFDALAARSPRIWSAITTELARRLGHATASGALHAEPPLPRTIAICRAGGQSSKTDLPRIFADALGSAFPPSLSVRVLDGEAAARALDAEDATGASAETQWFNTFEARHDHVVYVADPDLTDWSRKALRQADLVLCVGHGGPGPAREPNLLEHFAAQLHGKGVLELVLLQDGAAPYDGTRSWLHQRSWIERHHHVRLPSSSEAPSPQTSGLDRLVRFIRGTAVGLVACGGGAYSAAHVGVFDALAEAGIVFDMVGGTSGGAAMTAALALGVPTDEIERRTHDIFITRKAMRRWTWPRYSLLDHTAFDSALADHFTSTDIEDLVVPFFAVATNLTRNAAQCITRGPLWQAVRASAAIPAMLPPVFNANGEMLVDGCVIENTPLRTIRALKSGPNVVIDFATPEPERQPIDTSALPARGEIIARVLTGGARTLPRAPGPHAVLMRALMINRPDFARDMTPADILVVPPIPPGMSPLDWHRHRELRILAREYARVELSRLQKEGHALLARGLSA